MNWLATTAIKAVLEWLTSLLVRFREKQEIKEEGRQEVLQTIEKKEQDVEKALHEVGKASAGATDDDFARSMRDGYNADLGKDGVLGRRLPTPVSNSSNSSTTGR